MRARAASAEDTRRRILVAARDIGLETMSVEIMLRDVAERAGVSVQTVLRHFGTRDGLFAATVQFATSDFAGQRGSPPIGGPSAVVGALYDEYERTGDFMVRMLGQEFSNADVGRLTEQGRQMHHGWVRTAFGPQLASFPAQRRDEIADLLVVATDLYTWKVLRRDRALSQRDAEQRTRTLIAAVLAATPEGT